MYFKIHQHLASLRRERKKSLHEIRASRNQYERQKRRKTLQTVHIDKTHHINTRKSNAIAEKQQASNEDS